MNHPGLKPKFKSFLVMEAWLCLQQCSTDQFKSHTEWCYHPKPNSEQRNCKLRVKIVSKVALGVQISFLSKLVNGELQIAIALLFESHEYLGY